MSALVRLQPRELAEPHGLRASSWPKRVDMLLGLPRLELADAPGQAAEPAAL